MTKEQSKALGLDQILDLLPGEGELLAKALRLGLKSISHNPDKITAAYLRIGKLMQLLREEFFSRRLSYLLESLVPAPEPGAEISLGIADLFELKSFIYYYNQVCELSELAPLGYKLPILRKLFALLDPDQTMQPGFRLSPSYSKALAQAVSQVEELGQRLKVQRGLDLRKASDALVAAGHSPLHKTEFILSRSQTKLLEAIESSSCFVRSAESVANISFKLANSPEAEKLLKALSVAREKQLKAEEAALRSLNRKLLKYLKPLQIAQHTCLELGWDFLRSRFGIKFACCIPTLAKTDRIKIKGLRNLELEIKLQEQNRSYQAQDLDFCNSINLITGPNMGGKTKLLLGLAQAAQLMQWAIPLPAERAELPLFDQIYYNHDTTQDNLSSFGREIVSLCRALERGKHSLMLLDEFAKGTNPAEAEALSSAVLLYLQNTRHFCVAATHFNAPALLAGIDQFMMAGLDKTLLQSMALQGDLSHRLNLLSDAMDYRLVKLKKKQRVPQAALEIARALGLPEEILKLAEKNDFER